MKVWNMDILIVEDEVPAQKHLIESLKTINPEINVLQVLDTVSGTVEYLDNGQVPDFILMDIHLADGISFEIFKRTIVGCPVIFVTAYDTYWLKAFENNGIDYLLKPLQIEDLQRALLKYKNLSKHLFDVQKIKGLQSEPTLTNVQRLITQKGNESLVVHINEVAYLFTEHKLVFVIEQNGNRSVLDESLSSIEQKLPSSFFRINRKYVVNIKAIKKFKTLEKSRLEIILEPPVKELVIVSQENSRKFKDWVSGG